MTWESGVNVGVAQGVGDAVARPQKLLHTQPVSPGEQQEREARQDSEMAPGHIRCRYAAVDVGQSPGHHVGQADRHDRPQQNDYREAVQAGAHGQVKDVRSHIPPEDGIQPGPAGRVHTHDDG